MLPALIASPVRMLFACRLRALDLVLRARSNIRLVGRPRMYDIPPRHRMVVEDAPNVAKNARHSARRAIMADTHGVFRSSIYTSDPAVSPTYLRIRTLQKRVGRLRAIGLTRRRAAVGVRWFVRLQLPASATRL